MSLEFRGYVWAEGKKLSRGHLQVILEDILNRLSDVAKKKKAQNTQLNCISDKP